MYYTSFVYSKSIYSSYPSHNDSLDKSDIID